MLNKRDAYIFDLDGVLSNNDARVHLLCQENKDRAVCWQEFLEASATDDVYADTAALLKPLRLFGYDILLVTGRSEKYNDLLEEWLVKYNLKPYISKIFTRDEGDHRKDFELKCEIYKNKIQDKYRVFGVFEDRNECVEMWRSLGLTCYQPREKD